MKVVLTGVTGLVGSATLKQCIKDERITSIIALSRRELPLELTSSEKVKVIIHKDFLQYPDNLLGELRDSEACLWSIGGPVDQFPDVETAKKVQIDYTLAAAEAFAARLLPQTKSKTFRFVLCSAALAERDDAKKLIFESATRHIKGQVENGLIDIAKRNSGFETFIMRPAGILPEHPSLSYTIAGAIIPSVKVTELAAVMIDVAVEGAKEQTLENGEIARRGKALVKEA
ncbi:hypothetical protein NA57DRAFT_54635 [Rhizodiscina lignyota]|uniref:NAD(P)-binding domain-containing protein n=1 Tax=Rhizodiscina lignyota TaxID=1504668 RepID=A0A9P4MAP6_9PEZI|nr:hypothetical protein NA57DRAFT_54635 [Rhizodiscina lignyota]